MDIEVLSKEVHLMGKPRNIRFPEELEEKIEEARFLDQRRDFTDEVIYLVELGLREASYRREVIERDYYDRHRGPGKLPKAVGEK